MIPAHLPDGLIARPPTRDDIAIVADLFEVAELADRGEAETTREDILSGWKMPDWDQSEESILITEDGAAVAYAEIRKWRAEVAVHPAARGRGIGTAILRWTEQATLARVRPDEEARIGQTIKDTSKDAVALFEANGYTPRHTSWVLRLPRGVEITDRPLPPGYAIRPFDPDNEQRAVYEVIEDAFNEWPNRTPATFESWREWTTGRADFDPAHLFVAVHSDEIVGASLGLPYPEEGWVQQIAVHRDHRHRGLAQALLRASFETFRSAGHPEVGLSTDSRTGALDLYLKVGMVVRATYTHYSKLLRPAG